MVLGAVAPRELAEFELRVTLNMESKKLGILTENEGFGGSDAQREIAENDTKVDPS